MDWDVIIEYFLTSAAIFFVVGIIWNTRKMLVGNAMPDEMADLAKREPPTPRQKFACWMGHHDWVSRVDLGVDVDKEQVNSKNAVNYFFFFSAPVCKHCPTQLPPRYPDAKSSGLPMGQQDTPD